MSQTIPYNLQFSTNGESVLGIVENRLGSTDRKTRALKRSFGDCFKSLFSFSLALEGLQQLESGLTNLIQPGVSLNTQMADLAAITGLADDGLQKIQASARQSAKVFGTDASANIESYKLLLSQLSPDLAQNDKALGAMGKSVNILSKTMGGDTVAATNVLTTAMNQYGVSLEDPVAASKKMAEMMNTMSAGAKQGSAELPQIAAALQNAGLMAKTANVSFEETNAAIQILDKAGKKGAEGGVALRNVLTTLSQGRFLPRETRQQLQGAGVDIRALSDTTTPLSERLKVLSPVLQDSALITKLFGKENSAAANALLLNVEALEELTPKITGTSTAVEQADIVMGSYSERVGRLQTKLTDLKIGFFNATQSITPYLDIMFSGAVGLGQLALSGNALITIWRAKDELLRSVGSLFKWNTKLSFAYGKRLNWLNIKMMAGAVMSRIQSVGLRSVAISFGQATLGATAFSLALDALGIGLIIAGVVALVYGIQELWKNSLKFNRALGSLGGGAMAVFRNIGVFLGRLWRTIVKPIAKAWLNYYVGIFKGIWSTLKGTWNGIVSIVSWAWNSVLQPIAAAIGSAFTWVFESIGSVAVSVWDAISSTGVAMWNWFSETFTGFATWIDTVIVEPIRTAFSDIWTWLSTLLDGAMQKLDGLLAPIKTLWNTLFSPEGYESVSEAAEKGADKAEENYKKRKKEQEKKKEESSFGLPMGSTPKTPSFGAHVTSSVMANGSENTSTGGGTSSKTLNISKLIETLNIYSENKQTTKQEIKNLVREALLEASADFTLAT